MADIKIAKTVAMTQAELIRSLPFLLPDKSYSIRHDTIVCEVSERLLLIRMQSCPARVLGALRLPQLQLELEFTGFSQNAVDAFLLHFARIYHRGGG